MAPPSPQGGAPFSPPYAALVLWGEDHLNIRNVHELKEKESRLVGLELTTFGFGGQRSIL